MSTNAPPSDEHAQIRAYLTSLQLRAWSHALTLRLAHIRNDAEYRYNTASGVLLQFGARALVGTAWHVLKQFQQLRGGGEEVVIVCDNMPIQVPRIVYCDEQADIVFLDVPQEGRDGIGAVPYRPSRLWPPPAVNPGDMAFLCGFPKRFRQDGDEILHADLNLLQPVASVGDNYFMIQVDYDTIIDAGRVSIPREQVDYGGMSGGPVFLSDSEGSPLVGIVSEASESLPLWRIASLATIPDDLDVRRSELL